MRRRAIVILLAVAAAVIVVAIVRHGRGGRPIPVRSPVPAAPRLARPLGAALDAVHARDDATYRNDFLSTFTSMTPENAMKWAVVEPRPGKFAFGDADALAGFAVKTHKRIRGHTLVWDEQLPAWMTDRAWTAAALTKALTTHIDTTSTSPSVSPTPPIRTRGCSSTRPPPSSRGPSRTPS